MNVTLELEVSVQNEDVEVNVVPVPVSPLETGSLEVTELVGTAELFVIQVPVVGRELVDEDPDTRENGVAEALPVERLLLKRTEPVIEASVADVLVTVGQRVLSDTDDSEVPIVTAVDELVVGDDQLPDRAVEVEELSVSEVGG